MDKIKLELTIEEMHSIMTAVESYRIHLINTAIKNGEDHRFDGTIERLGALDAALYRKLTNFLYDEVESSEKEDAPLTEDEKVDFLENAITMAEKNRIEAEKLSKSDMKKVREELTGALTEDEFIKIVDRLYDKAHNPPVKNAKAKIFPDIKLSMYRFM